MLFPTIKFAVFFVIVFFLYWYVFRKEKERKILLVIASYFFYTSWNWKFCILLLAISLLNYFFGFLLEKEKNYKPRKLLIIAITTINILYLCFFKYFYLLLAYLNQYFPQIQESSGFLLNIKTFSFLIPVGISYYTFKCMSYTFDIYLCKMRHSKCIWDVLLYISFFPQISLGPIVKAEYFLKQLKIAVNCDNDKNSKPIELDRATLLLISGLYKKMVIANFLTILVLDKIFVNPAFFNTAELIFGILCYTIVIYADFSGYSDMAVGIALLLGFQTPKNFNRPYLSTSITEFWRRWHISFSSWLRDYLYFGLGGSRFTVKRTIFALFFTMLIAGFWHGARWTFIIWGSMQGIMLITEKIISEKNKKNKFEVFENQETKKTSNFYTLIRIALVFIFVNISWFVFFSNSLSELKLFLISLKNFSLPFQVISPIIIIVFLGGLFLQLPSEHFRQRAFNFYVKVPFAFKIIFTVLFSVFIYTVSTSGIPQFIYFQF